VQNCMPLTVSGLQLMVRQCAHDQFIRLFPRKRKPRGHWVSATGSGAIEPDRLSNKT